jgi:hypothetical protein
MQLVRHKQQKFHIILGFGVVLEDYGYKVLVRWISPKSHKHTKHIMTKNALVFLDPNEKDCIKEPEIKWKV